MRRRGTAAKLCENTFGPLTAPLNAVEEGNVLSDWADSVVKATLPLSVVLRLIASFRRWYSIEQTDTLNATRAIFTKLCESIE